MIKAILFDFDDTLIRTLETKIHALKHVGKKYYNMDIHDEDVKKHWGKPFEVFMDALYKNVEELEKIIEKYTTERVNFPTPAYEGTIEALKKLSNKYLLGIITSHSKRYIKKDLEYAGIPANIFFTIQTEEESPCHKPDPKVFDLVVEKLMKKGVKKPEILYIGDSLLDYYASRDAGLQFYGLANRTIPKQEFESKGAKTINSLSELVSMLNR